MARSRGPQNLVTRTPGRSAESRAHDMYGDVRPSTPGSGRASGYRAADDGRPVGAADLLRRPVALVLVALLLFAALVAVWAWQSGAFARMFPARHVAAAPSPTRWMVGRPDRGQRPQDVRQGVDGDAPAPAPAESDDDEGNTTD